MTKIISSLTIISALFLANMSLAGDIKAGQAKAVMCAGCHGANGISTNTMWPNLAGQKKGYLAKQIRDFRDGKRNDPMMASMVKSLSDADAANLAAYYSQIK